MSTVNNNIDFELIKQTLRKKYDLSTISYVVWIEPIELYSVEDEIVYVTVPMDRPHTISYLVAKYKDKFEEVLLEEYGFSYKIEIMAK